MSHEDTRHADPMTKHAHHVIPVKIYLAIWVVLVFLTFVTVAASRINLGPLNVPIAIGIASFKAALVALFFMHLWYDEKYNLVIFGAGLAFLVIFLGLTAIDPISRGVVNTIEASEIRPEMSQPMINETPAPVLPADQAAQMPSGPPSVAHPEPVVPPAAH
jgi:cytochrome c oxidase subunit 4